MVRAAIVGMTDYSHQSLSDMQEDLHSWIIALNETNTTNDAIVNELVLIRSWSQCDYDFRSIYGYSRKFFDTATTNLKDVIDGIASEIQEYHIRELFNLAATAHEIYDNAKKVWSEYRDKDYNDPVFKKVESIHYEICNMTGDMFDLNNLAHRLKDFVGRKASGMSENSRVNNIFHAPVTGFQQNLDHSTGTQNIATQTTDQEELKAIMLEIKQLLSNLPAEGKKEIEESIGDLEEALQDNSTKKSRIRAFGVAVSSGLKSLFTMDSFNKIDEVSTKLPQVVENFEKVLHKIIGS
jgi:vacuolar-type H+-ATPase subunit E/Vma4